MSASTTPTRHSHFLKKSLYKPTIWSKIEEKRKIVAQNGLLADIRYGVTMTRRRTQMIEKVLAASTLLREIRDSLVDEVYICESCDCVVHTDKQAWQMTQALNACIRRLDMVKKMMKDG
jgi:hypothetical protein